MLLYTRSFYHLLCRQLKMVTIIVDSLLQIVYRNEIQVLFQTKLPCKPASLEPCPFLPILHKIEPDIRNE